MPKIAGLRAVSNFPAEVERKLFIHNLGHAALAYLGYREGYTYIHEAIKDEKIRKILDGAWEEVSRALLQKHPDLDSQEHEKVETCKRDLPTLTFRYVRASRREPLRKLAPEDRLIGERTCVFRKEFSLTI